MRITNKKNLPAPLVRVLEKISQQYDAGKSDYTATSLLKPARMLALEKQHSEALTEDASSLIYSAVGTSIHSMLETAGEELRADGFIVEQRFYIEIDGVVVGAKIDLYDTKTGTLWDYKNTSVYSVKGGAKEEYAQQLNIGAECLRQNGHEVKALKIAALLRDWSKGARLRDVQAADKAGVTSDYPEDQYAELDIPVIHSPEVIGFIKERIKAHTLAQASLPDCSNEERWMRDEKWAVMKKGGKRAVRLFDSQDSAISQAEMLGKDYSVEHRPGTNTRCEMYCKVANFCEQWKRLNKGENNE